MTTLVERAKRVIKIEADEIAKLEARLEANGTAFEGAAKAILACEGKTIVSGMGKSGLIGQKIAATLASTGTPSFFLHPAEAYHGDLGMIDPRDVLLLLSSSGETDETLKIVPFLQDQGNTIIALTGNANSTLAQAADFHLDCAVDEEACLLKLAPTSSTTAALVIGDALAVALMDARDFKAENFARFHPGGNLGRRLLTRVEHEMVALDRLPIVASETIALDVLRSMTLGKLGIAIVCNAAGKLLGVVTDGDIRRSAEANSEGFFALTAAEMMTRSPKTITPDMRLAEAEELMDLLKVHQMIVLDAQGNLVGLLPYRAALTRRR